MGQYVGLDVSLEVTTVHVLDEQGKRVWHGTCVSHPAAIEATIRKHAPEVVRIGLETGPLTTWLWQALTDAGLPMVCLDARQAKAALNMRINKTDDNDAEGLAQLVRSGWYREVRVKSREAMLVRSLIGARTQLLGYRDRAVQPDPRPDEDLRSGRAQRGRQSLRGQRATSSRG